MRNSASGSTPKTNTVQDQNVSNVERTSGKKLKQARLPFKTIGPATSPGGLKVSSSLINEGKNNKDTVKQNHYVDGRKRRLSYDADDNSFNTKEDDNLSKENVRLVAAITKKKRLSAVSNNDTPTDFVVLDDDDDIAESSSEDVANSSISNVASKSNLSTPNEAIAKDKKNGAGTPHQKNAQNEKNGSATKLQIKLPLSASKKKRKKSIYQTLHNGSATENLLSNLKDDLSSDDKELAIGLNPQKRKKLNAECDGVKCIDSKEEQIDIIDLNSEQEEDEDPTPETEKSKHTVKERNRSDNENTNKAFEQCETYGAAGNNEELKKESNFISSSEKSTLKSKTIALEISLEKDVKNIEISDSSDENEIQKTDNEAIKEDVQSDNEADDETDTLTRNSINALSDINENKETNLSNKQKSVKSEKATASSAKNLTQKQIRLMEQRRKTREEKERRLQEEKLKKQQEKEEKEMAKKREREEKEDQKRKDREEKEEQKRKDREERERKRLAEIEAKNAEKRKKNEAKEEELRKKEEERKRKEQEKEEAELKKKKAAQAFTKFFVSKTPNNASLKAEDSSNTGDGSQLLAFRPFQIKGDMKLAPICRRTLTGEEKTCLENLLVYNNDKPDVDENENKDEEINRHKPLPYSQLYLSELSSGRVLPGQWRRPSTESKDDVIFVEDELERVGQAIIEDNPAYIREKMRVKFFKFHDNRRPPYYGTWRKKSTVVKPRQPFAQDKKYFDYEIDSDDEWEEEEPGESLEDCSDEDKEKESEDDDYEVDNEWFVPHGHLSEEELQNQDEFGINDDNTREAQKAKLQILQQEFAQEMKKKTEKIKPRLIGCIWADINGNQPPECAKILWDTLEKKAMIFVDPPIIEEPDVDRSTEPNSPTGITNGNTEKVTDKLKPITLSDEMVKDLTRLIHGNNHAKNFLINEYIAYVEKTSESVKNGDLRKPLKSVVRDKIDEIAEWQVVNASASSVQEMEQVSGETNDKKKKKVKRRLCWVVKQEMLDKMDLSSLKLKNSWKYTLPPKFVNADKDVETHETSTSLTSAERSAKEKHHILLQGPVNDNSETKLQNVPSSPKISFANKVRSEKKPNASTTPKDKKRVPLLMSVARGQQIPMQAKNKLICEFLQQNNKDNAKLLSQTTKTTARSDEVISTDDVVVLN